LDTFKEVTMKGISSKILIILGIILILAAILWWAIAVNALVKLPDDMDIDVIYEGDATAYINPVTQQKLPEGSEIKTKMQVELIGTVDKAQTSSSTLYMPGQVITRITGLPESVVDSAIILDRKTSENVKDDRAFGWQYYYTDKQGNKQLQQGVFVDRAGNYFPLLPFDTSKDKTYPFWKEEVNSGFDLEFVNEEEKDGVTVYNFKGTFDEREAYAPYIQSLGLPTEISFDQIKPILVAAGFDVDGLVAVATQVMSPEDLQALSQIMQAKLPLKYLLSMDFEVSVEPKTGGLVDVYKDVETLSVSSDFSKLTSALAPIFAKYANDPTMGPVITKLQGLQAIIGEIPAEKALEYNLEQTDESVKQCISDAKKAAKAITLIKVYIPWVLLIVGALVLIIGLLIGGGGEPQEEE
jgi:Porin PorA